MPKSKSEIASLFNGRQPTPEELGMAVLQEVQGAGNLLRIRRLIKAGANLNVKAGDGKNALFHCIARQRDDAAVALVKAGIDLSDRDHDGYSCLHMAVGWNRVSVVEALLERNVNIDTKSRQGVTAMQIAEKKGYTDIVGMIRTAEDRRARAIREGMPTTRKIQPLNRISVNRRKPGKE